MKKTVDVILRTHSGANVHGGMRVFMGPKTELILGCLQSLLRTMKNIDSARWRIRLTVLDDHSEDACIQGIRTSIGAMPFEPRFISLESRGVGPSFGASYMYARDVSEDVIYFVEDDYLHAPSALPEMLEAQELFSKNLGGRDVAIFPVDYPTNYDPRITQPSYVVVGPHRHWHTDFSTTGTFLIPRSAFMKHIHLCMKMALYTIDPEISEANSINRMWHDGGVILFSPIPTLALHMQDQPIISPFIDWREWWNDYARE